jgi:N-acetylmuramoyl-L-alanine amidase
LKSEGSSRVIRRAPSRDKGLFARLCACCVIGLLLSLSGVASARIHRSQGWAEAQFAKAEAQRETLNGRASQGRSRREYEAVIASYRKIVLEAPTSSKADGSAFAVAEVTAEMGRHFKDDMALYSAVREYKYLRREYPGSKHRIEALLAIGEIYKNDLGDQADGRAAFQELVRRYPHSELVKEARAELGTEKVNTVAAKESPKGSATDPEDDKKESEAPGSQANASRPTEQTRAQTDGPVRVTDVQYWSGPDYTRITVSLQQDVQFESQRIPDPERIFFDLKNARLSSALAGQSYDVDDGLVKKIRVAQYKPGRARVVVETVGHAGYNASLVLNPPRIVIDLHGEDSATKETEAQSAEPDSHARLIQSKGDEGESEADDDQRASSESASRPIAVSTVAGVKKVVVDDTSDDDSPPRSISKAAAKTSAPRTSPIRSARSRESQPMSGGDRSLIRALGLRIGKIVIDPGHGGHDTGTIGPNGLLEKDLVLDVSKRLGKLLEARLGAGVVFTRRDDTFIPLETRTSIANQEQADLFVSVHANSSRDSDARGVETYYLNFTSSPDALEVAARENAAADKSIHELQDLVKKIALKEKIEESREFAADVQQSLHTGLAAKNTAIRDRGVKKAPFVVLIGANMPSILAEISFISNPNDEKRLKSADYRQRIAESLYRGIARYVNGLGGVKLATRIEKASTN